MLTEDRTELPRLTRFVHAVCLCGVEGISVGFGLATALYSSRLVQFVKTNRIDAKMRKEMLAVVLWPAFVLPLLVLALSLASVHLPKGRLHQVERRARILSPLCALGFFPLLLKPALWSDQPLAFLLVTGVFAAVITLTLRVSVLAWGEDRKGARQRTDFESLKRAISSGLLPRLLSILAVSVIVTLIGFAIVRPLRSTVLDGTAINAEWSTIRRISESSHLVNWLGQKGWRTSGHLGALGAVYAAAASLVSRPEGLLLLRLVGVSFAAIPLFSWSKRSLGAWPAFIMALAYLSMPLAGMLQLRDTFPITIALGIFFLAAHDLEHGRRTKGLILVLLGFALSEQIALWFALLGAYLATRDNRKSLGQWLAVTSLLYFLIATLVIMPRLGIRTYGPDEANRFSIGVRNLGPSLNSLLANPAFTLSRWFEFQSLEFWLALTVPVALLPLRGKHWLLWLSPVLLFACSATTQEANSQWRDPVFGHFLASGFLASVATLQTLRGSSTPHGVIRARVSVIGWALVLAPVVAMFGALYTRQGP